MLSYSIRTFFVSALCVVLSGSACKKSDPGKHSTPTTSHDAAQVDVVVPKKTQETKTEPSTQLERPFFYKVEGPNNANGYLLGTMHMGIDAENDLPDYVWTAIKTTKTVTLEADVSDPSLAMGMLLPKDTNLRKELGEETWLLLEEALGKAIAQALMPMKPAAAAAFLALKDLPKTVPMDLYLMNQAKSSGSELAYLETGRFQLDLLTRIMTAEFLGEMLRNPDASDSGKLLAIYRKGDEEALTTLMLDPQAWGSEKVSKANLKAMLYDRNENWIAKLETLFAKGNVLVAVGAAHLIGEKGVIDLLTKKGYKITRVLE